MAELNINKTERHISVRHLGRGAQVWIYLGKMLRMFIYQNDWKVVPMSAIIAGLVGMVIRNRMFLNMEGTIMGTFSMVMVCIWNGCFNSIQVICRERDVIKREHRSGMHISSYIAAHMMYQALLCLIQTGVTMYVTMIVGVQYGLMKPLVTPFFMLDFAISLFLITYASDMMALWVSTLARTTTTAMTVMPFVLIFQLVFSGGMLTLPEWAEPLTHFTISGPGIKVMCTQSDYNNQPVATLWNTLEKLSNSPVNSTMTLGQVVNLLENRDNATIEKVRGTEIGGVFTIRQVFDAYKGSAAYADIKDTALSEDVGLTVGQALDLIEATDAFQKNADNVINAQTTLGEIADTLTNDPEAQPLLKMSYTVDTTVGAIVDFIGKDKVQTILSEKTRETRYKPYYESTTGNVIDQWFGLIGFILAFAALSTITLEFIDKDKR